MKIRITEDQAKRLNIGQPSNPLESFKKGCEIANKQLNHVFLIVSTYTNDEILNGELDVHAYEMKVFGISDDVHVLYMGAYDYLDTLPENELDRVIDDLKDSVDKKLMFLEKFLDTCGKLEEKPNLGGVLDKLRETNLFDDIESIDITNN